MKKLLLIFLLVLLGTIYLIFFKFNSAKTHQVLILSLPSITPAAFLVSSLTPTTPIKVLPSRFLIRTAFIPQAPEKIWSEPWQDSCEEAALLNVYYYYRHQTPDVLTEKNAIISMINFENTQKYGISINTAEMSAIAQNYLHLIPKVINNPTIGQIKDYLSENIPVIVPADGKILFQENKHFHGGGPWYHNIVILGYDDSTGQFIVNDVGTQFGAYFHYSYPLLISAIHDFPDSNQPSDIASGAKNVLILLK